MEMEAFLGMPEGRVGRADRPDRGEYPIGGFHLFAMMSTGTAANTSGWSGLPGGYLYGIIISRFLHEVGHTGGRLAMLLEGDES